VRGWSIGALVLAAACGNGAPAGDAGGWPLDPDGVAMLLPSATGGTTIRLGDGDPSTAPFAVENGTAIAGTDGAVHFWNVNADPYTLPNGAPGYTARIHLHAPGTQQYTWHDQHGYLATPADLRNQEFTAYVRVHNFLDAGRAAVNLKIRGGAHVASNPSLASCAMMTLEPARTRYRKELDHPNYDDVKLTPEFSWPLSDGAWVGMKVLSFGPPGDSARVINRLYLDTDPFDAAGRPANHWRLFSEYDDIVGIPTGMYSTLVDWGGWETTLRSDGVHDLDFTLLSVREIQPPP
jgi:hypothetical protein